MFVIPVSCSAFTVYMLFKQMKATRIVTISLIFVLFLCFVARFSLETTIALTFPLAALISFANLILECMLKDDFEKERGLKRVK